MFLSSHLLGEVETICTRAAMMAQGRLVAQDTDRPAAGADGPAAHRHARHRRRRRRCSPACTGAPSSSATAARLRVELNGQPPEQLNQALVQAGVRVRELVVERRSLEDAYLGLTGGSGDARR